MILITGASGTVGSAVLKEVVKSGKPIRAMYRSKDAAAKVPAGATAAVADFADKQSLLSVLKGVDTVFLVCSPVRELVQLESNVIEACRDAGVRHIVLNSALGAGDYPKSFPSWHRKVEDKLKASGINHTILRPNGFMQNILAYFPPPSAPRVPSTNRPARRKSATSMCTMLPPWPPRHCFRRPIIRIRPTN